jgi:N-acetylglucosaminyldiphosphoundecaprenol N-acetyl-beta-D-mannosaminyltransferase
MSKHDRDNVPRFSFGGVNISSVDLVTAVDVFYDLITNRRDGYIACTCTHGVVDGQHDQRLRDIINGARMTLPDGMPLVWIGRIKGMPVERVTAHAFFEAAISDPRAKMVRHYFYGSTPRTMDLIIQRATATLGSDAIAGYHCPPFRPAGSLEEAAILGGIVASRPDVIWVGLGLPKQEYWMANHQSFFPSAIMVGVGAAFDFFAGTQPRAPAIWQSLGLEWAYRLAREPKRLWPRYRRVVPLAVHIMALEIAQAFKKDLTQT